jgi:hypothetical protein
MVCARLEGDVNSRAARRIASGAQRRYLGVRFAEPGVPSFPHHLVSRNDDGADHGVRRRLPPPATGEGECPAHERAIARTGRVLVRH